MPLRTGYQIGISVNPDGKTVSNVRDATFYDVAKPSRSWVKTGTVTSVSTGNGTWGLTLPRCFQLDASTEVVTTPVLVNLSNFTVMLRVRLPSLAASGFENVLFSNGVIGDTENFFFTQNNFGGNSYLAFLSANAGSIILASSPQTNTWYHLAVTTDSTGTNLEGYLDGAFVGNLAFVTVSPYWQTQSSFGYIYNNSSVDITDFVFLTKSSTAAEIANYAKAPFL
jgi:hypothetical protein